MNSSSNDELPGMLALAKGVAEQTFPHTIDAQVWASEFTKVCKARGLEPFDEGWMVSWFANAIMAGYDTATARNAANVHHLQRQLGYLSAEISRVNGREIPAIVEEAANATREP